MIRNAKGKSVIDLKSDKRYEVTIQWMLSVAGFQAIWLNNNEKLLVDSHLYGTVDCLAYSEKDSILLFVNCTLGNPSEKELSSYREVLHYFEDNVFNNTSVKAYSVVFSNAKLPATVHWSNGDDESIVFYKNQIDELFELIVTGQESEFVKLIRNQFSPFFGIMKGGKL
jgi:hypothetical protein